MKYLFTILIIFIAISNLYATRAFEHINVKLDWKFQFQHAGLIVAKEKGFFTDAGLDVTLLEYVEGDDIASDVLLGKVNFGISNTSLIYDQEGLLQPTVLVATYLQKSPLVFVTQANILTPTQLENTKIMITDYEYKNSSLSLLLDHFFIKSTNIPHSFGIKEFREKKVEAISAFISNELYNLDEEHIPYNIIDPSDYGFTTNAMNLFTSYTYAKQHTKTVQKFLNATNKGWEYSLANIEEVIAIIQKKYRPSKSIDELRYEALKIKDLMLLNLFDIGETNKELMTRTYKQLVRSEKLKSGQEAHIMSFNDVLIENQESHFKLNDKEKEYLETKGPLKLCVDPAWMPFEAIKNGKHIGLAADFFDILRKKSGLDMKLYPTSTWEESIKVAKNRQCDIFTLASKTPERLIYMNFTEPYVTSPIVLTTKIDKQFIDDLTKLKDKKIGVVKGYAIEKILKDDYHNLNIIEVKNALEGLAMVERGTLYGYVDNLMVVAWSIQKDFIGILKISARLKEDVKLSIATRNDEPLLGDIFKKLFDSITENEKQKVLNNWVSVEESVSMNYPLLVKIFIFILMVFIIFAIYNYQLRRYNRKLQELSRIDTLTRISNRLKLDEVLQEQEKLVARYESSCGVILVDIDDFKRINDYHGHLVGDEVLKEFSLILKANIRATDVLGRWGGEEFLIICPNTNSESLEIISEQLREKIEKFVFNHDLHITASFGISTLDDTKNSYKAVNEADDALYRAKKRGKNRIDKA